MSKNRAIGLIEAAIDGEMSEASRKMLGSALNQLKTASDEEPIDFLDLAAEMIEGSLQRLIANLPGYADSPEDKIQKFAICESALLSIKEYSAQALKSRLLGSGSAIEFSLRDYNIQEFDVPMCSGDAAKDFVDTMKKAGATVQVEMVEGA